MRIAQVAPLAESVPPKLYGGTERVVAWLIDELIELGHDVTLFASGDSVTRANLVPAWPRALRLSRPRADPAVAQAALLEAVAREAANFDVIHCHVDWVHLPLLERLGVPFLTTLHNRIDTPGVAGVMASFADAAFVSISDHQRRPSPEANWLATVYHGLPPDSLRPRIERGTYLAFLGRLTPDKGPEAAIEIARAIDMPLRIAAKVPRAERRYFKERLEPLVDGDHIQLLGEVDECTKQAFLEQAAALLFPIDWPEPFGLVMIEAAARGTPVLAYPRGSVREVIDEGVTGMVVEDVDQAVAALPDLLRLPRASVRSAVEQRFSQSRMAGDYVELYRRLIAGARRDELASVPIRPTAMADLAPMNGGNPPDEAPAHG